MRATSVLTADQREVVDHYWARFTEKRGCAPPLPIAWAKALGEKVTQDGKAKAMECVDRFFAAESAFITGGNYHIPALLWVWAEMLSGNTVDKATVERRRRLLQSICRLDPYSRHDDAQVNAAWAAYQRDRAK
jgi:hypothetical protein